VTALRDERITNGCKIVLRRHAYQQWSAIDQTYYFGVVQSKQLPTNDLAVFDLDAVVRSRKMVTDSWYSTNVGSWRWTTDFV